MQHINLDAIIQSISKYWALCYHRIWGYWYLQYINIRCKGENSTKVSRKIHLRLEKSGNIYKDRRVFPDRGSSTTKTFWKVQAIPEDGILKDESEEINRN